MDHRRPTTWGPPGGLGAQVLKSGRLLRLIFCLPDIGGPPLEAPWVARGPMGGQGPRFSKETILVEIFHFFLFWFSQVQVINHAEGPKGLKSDFNHDMT